MVDGMNKWWVISLLGAVLLLVIVVTANRSDPDEPRASDLDASSSESSPEGDDPDQAAGEPYYGHAPVSDPADPDAELDDRNEGDHDVAVDESTVQKYEKEATKTVTAFSKEINQASSGWHKRIEPYTVGRLHDGLKDTDPARLVDRGEITDTEVLDSDIGWIAMTATYEDGSTLLFGVTVDQPHWRVETYEPYRPEDGS